ncbi:hypothetical protein HPB50_014464 [Hyalomma asiaticum]|uniref:Uncharacterized protein n=1 Tax=Hyalomma asiaticum TaxID=266040 RepID=A0ACB7T2K9_HYAAI|nr:hypothetical protein HPB50_014464 [Hyalomma asiaticum]
MALNPPRFGAAAAVPPLGGLQPIRAPQPFGVLQPLGGVRPFGGAQPFGAFAPFNGQNEGEPIFQVVFDFGHPPLGRGRGNPQLLPATGDNSSSMLALRNRKRTAERKSQVGQSLRPPDWKTLPLPSFRKDFYREHTRTAQRPSEEVEAYRNANEITVTGCGAPKPILRVEEAGFSESVTKAIEVLNPCGSSPTPLQAQCWPVALCGRDVVAEVGTPSNGKSLAYLVPAVVHVQHQTSTLGRGSPKVLVLTATRELAHQVRVAVGELTERSAIRAMCLVSGEPKQPQLKQLEEGADICIATPGRLIAFMEECKVNLRRCTFLAIDELDNMLTMGLGDYVRTIAYNIRPDRQTFALTASGTKESLELAQELTKDSIIVRVGTAIQKCHKRRVQHIVFVCDEAEKENELVKLLRDVLNDEDDKAVVFVERKQTVEDLASTLCLQGWKAAGIHGNKTEQERRWALDALRSGNVSILVATDLVARATGLCKVRIVVSYDYPSNPAEYPRRFEHAVRPDGSGTKCTFLGPDECAHAKELVRFLRENKQPLPPQLRKVANKATRK